ncbi:hypothetical protein EDD11_002176 [Mortierella claussenii]|nr:hypothetical protein EDD11_002176 [Mortierella claussenii]
MVFTMIIIKIQGQTVKTVGFSTVYDLKHLIKEQYEVKFKETDANSLSLWRVDIPFLEGDGVQWRNVIERNNFAASFLRPEKRMIDLFPGSPNEMCRVRVLVKLQDVKMQEAINKAMADAIFEELKKAKAVGPHDLSRLNYFQQKSKENSVPDSSSKSPQRNSNNTGSQPSSGTTSNQAPGTGRSIAQSLGRIAFMVACTVALSSDVGIFSRASEHINQGTTEFVNVGEFASRVADCVKDQAENTYAFIEEILYPSNI